MRKSIITASVIAALFAFTGSACAVTGQAGLDELQKKVDAMSAKAGVKSQNVKEELLKGATKGGNKAAAANVVDSTATHDAAGLPVIRKMTIIPVQSIRAVENAGGQVFYLSNDNRYAFVGQLVDIWNRKKLSSIEDIENSVSHIDLKRMGFMLDKTNHISVGNGKKHAVIFVDPQCGWCHKLMLQIQGDKQLQKDYTFDIVVLGLLGEDSQKLAKKLACTKITDQKRKFNALVTGEREINKLPQLDKCNDSVLDDTELQRGALNIKAVPFLISPDSRFTSGFPDNLAEFLDADKAKVAKAKRDESQQKLLRQAEKAYAEKLQSKAKKQ